MPKQWSGWWKRGKNVALQVNDATLFENAVIFLGENFVRITAENDGMVTNVYYDWKAIESMKTVSPKEG